MRVLAPSMNIQTEGMNGENSLHQKNRVAAPANANADAVERTALSKYIVNT
jgi:hypothetical protein